MWYKWMNFRAARPIAAQSSVARIFMSNFSRSSPQIASFFDESSTPLSCEGMDEESKRMNRSLDCPDTDYRPFRGVPHIFAGRYIREGMSGSFSRSSLSLFPSAGINSCVGESPTGKRTGLRVSEEAVLLSSHVLPVFGLVLEIKADFY